MTGERESKERDYNRVSAFALRASDFAFQATTDRMADRRDDRHAFHCEGIKALTPRTQGVFDAKRPILRSSPTGNPVFHCGLCGMCGLPASRLRDLCVKAVEAVTSNK